MKIDKLHDGNYHIWKHRVKAILSLKDLDEYIENDSSTSDIDQTDLRRDKQARAVLTLAMSDVILEQVQHARTAYEMWSLIADVFEKHTLFNKLAVRRQFITASLKDDEKVLEFASRIRRLADTLKSMGVIVEDSEMAMALLNGLPDRFDGLISAIDALCTSEESFTFEFVKSRCTQEEHRQNIRIQESIEKSESQALLADSSNHDHTDLCVWCGRHKDSDRCFTKYPHLAPEWWLSRNNKNEQTNLANVKEQKESAMFSETCLIGRKRTKAAMKSKNLVPLKTYEDAFPNGSHLWFIDSQCTSHMTFDRKVFSSYTKIPKSRVYLGANKSATIIGQGNVTLKLNINGKSVKCLIRDVKHVPSLHYQLLSKSVMQSRDVRVFFDDDSAVLLNMRQSRIMATATQHNGLYALDGYSEKALVTSLGVNESEISEKHEKRCKLKTHCVERGEFERCRSGRDKRQHRKHPHSRSTSQFSAKRSINKHLLEQVHTEIIGPFKEHSGIGSCYIITFVDDYSNWTVHYKMRDKSEALNRLKRYKKYAEKKTSCALKKLIVHVDQTEHKNSAKSNVKSNFESIIQENEAVSSIKNFLKSKKIMYELRKAPALHKYGGVLPVNQKLCQTTESMLSCRQVDIQFWVDAYATAVHTWNRRVNKTSVKNATPYELWHERPPNVSHLQEFGATCWYSEYCINERIETTRYKKAVLMGYASQARGYKLWDVDERKYTHSRFVKFEQNDRRSCTMGEHDLIMNSYEPNKSFSNNQVLIHKFFLLMMNLMTSYYQDQPPTNRQTFKQSHYEDCHHGLLELATLES